MNKVSECEDQHLYAVFASPAFIGDKVASSTNDNPAVVEFICFGDYLNIHQSSFQQCCSVTRTE